MTVTYPGLTRSPVPSLRPVDTIAHHEGFTTVTATESGALLSNIPSEVDDVTLCALAAALNDAVFLRMGFKHSGDWP